MQTFKDIIYSLFLASILTLFVLGLCLTLKSVEQHRKQQTINKTK